MEKLLRAIAGWLIGVIADAVLVHFGFSKNTAGIAGAVAGALI